MKRGKNNVCQINSIDSLGQTGTGLNDEKKRIYTIETETGCDSGRDWPDCPLSGFFMSDGSN